MGTVGFIPQGGVGRVMAHEDFSLTLWGSWPCSSAFACMSVICGPDSSGILQVPMNAGWRYGVRPALNASRTPSQLGKIGV